MPSNRTIVLGVTGSIAAVKAPEIVRLFREKGYAVRCVLTKNAEKFVSPLALSTFCGAPVVVDMFGPDAHTMSHLSLAAEASLFVVAPSTAATMARMAYGLADDMVSLTYITTTAPTLIAPAMHDTMWLHAATQAAVKILTQRGVSFVGPIKGKLADQPSADGRMSDGRMVEPEEIVQAAEKILHAKT